MEVRTCFARRFPTSDFALTAERGLRRDGLLGFLRRGHLASRSTSMPGPSTSKVSRATILPQREARSRISLRSIGEGFRRHD